MHVWKRIATFILVGTAAFFSLFWITAFTTAEVAQLEPGEAPFVSAMTMTPASLSKSAASMNRDASTLRKGGDGSTCLQAVDHSPAGKHHLRREAV